jgi:hypothetical protein
VGVRGPSQERKKGGKQRGLHGLIEKLERRKAKEAPAADEGLWEPTTDSDKEGVPGDFQRARAPGAVLHSIGLDEDEPRVVHQFLDLAYRYVGGVLGDAQVYSDHAGKPQIDADDIWFAIQIKVNFSSQLSPSEVQIPPKLMPLLFLHVVEYQAMNKSAQSETASIFGQLALPTST